MKLFNHTGFDNRPLVLTMPVHEIKYRSKDHGRSVQQTGPVHSLRGWVHRNWPKGEEHGDKGPDQGQHIGGNTPFP